MKQALRDAWCAALRSDKYKQAQEKLRTEGLDGDEHCCLGVLCDIVDPAGWFGHEHRLSQQQVLTLQACKELGLEQDLMNSFVRANDGESPSIITPLAPALTPRDESGEGYRPASFVEIADLIEKHVPIDFEEPAK